MAINFTDEQLKVINSRGKNLLVSAAAGSGKTAVLVERIIQIITDEEHPVDIDKMLVVTFTEAAAAQMREKIARAIELRLSENPENVHLQKQAALIYKAQISTIHSFCLNVIRNNFNKIDLDPAFRIADETELKLMQEDVLESLLEDKYQKKEEGFMLLSDYFSKKADDSELRDTIIKIYEFSEGYPWPEEWLQEILEVYETDSIEKFENLKWVKELVLFAKAKLSECVNMLEKAKSIALMPNGPENYAAFFDDEEEMISRCLKYNDYESLREEILKIDFKRIPTAKKGCDEILKEKAKNIRDSVKGIVSDQKKYDSVKGLFSYSAKDEIEKLNAMSPMVRELVNLVLEFSREFLNRRNEKGIISFGDMEHYALNILYSIDEKGNRVLSNTALEYRDSFEEILMDEYQDCNRVQEELMCSICGESNNRYNRFMVGDVKQSIYKFRLANPELFIDKYNCYRTGDLESQGENHNELICLHNNFRSRKNVVNTVNDLFGQVIHKDLGDVEYDNDARLVLGASYPLFMKQNEDIDFDGYEIKEENECFKDLTETGENKTKIEEDRKTDVIRSSESTYVIDENETLWNTEIHLADLDNDSDLKKNEQEAYMIAGRIRELVGLFWVTDEESGELRKARYKDIVILVRSMTDVAEGLRKVLTCEGIPSIMSLNTGFYDTREIQTIIQLLQLLDNPRQDIPLYGSLHSFFGKMSDEEIAKLKAVDVENDTKYWALYDYLCYAADNNEKACRFLELLNRYRKMAVYTPIHDLIQIIVDETGYLDYITAMSAGEQRRMNVNMLILKAKSYEATSFKGLFHFIRYIKELRKIEADQGEAEMSSASADAVRIMTIHKSKGLEFPICFIAGIHKQFNFRDSTGIMAADMNLGIGFSYVDTKRRIRNNPLFRKVVNLRIHQDLLGEELRVLYVAMTRAREKLIITGCVKDKEKLFTKVSEIKSACKTSGRMPYVELCQAKSYMDFMLPIMDIAVVHDADEIGNRNVGEAIDRIKLKGDLLSKASLVDSKIPEFNELKGKLEREYPHKNLEGLVLKTSVSELKKAYIDMELSADLFAHNEELSYEPSFVKETDNTISATDRGNAYHKVMELLDFSDDDIKSQINTMFEKHLISKTWVDAVNPEKIERFMTLPLAKRMASAQREGQLKKEQPFVYGMSANRIDIKYPEEEQVLLQGIIDAFFIENGEIVLVDYKTDKVLAPSELIDRYHVQLDYYKEAIESILGMKVKESILYSFALGEEVVYK